MWIFVNHAYLSAVEHCDSPGLLLVRARKRGDLESVFDDGITVEETPDADYRFRAVVPRTEFKRVIARQIDRINYYNFKGSIPAHDPERAMHYGRVWSISCQWQQTEAEREAPTVPAQLRAVDSFAAKWCANCAKDNAANGTRNLDDCDDGELCWILSQAYRSASAGLPDSYRRDSDGALFCSEFDPLTSAKRPNATKDALDDAE